MAALKSIRILELSNGWTASTLAGRLLAELGAEVMKVEPPEGDFLRHREPCVAEGHSYAFALASALKSSVVVPQAKRAECLETLAVRSDVFLIEAEIWQELAASGLTPDALQQRFPHLILCLISPFGLQGSEDKGGWSELILQASTGLMATTGFPDDPPMRSGVPAITHGAAILATIAVLTALYERRQSGLGQVIDLAGYDVGLSFLGTFLPGYFRYGTSPRRIGNRHPLAVPWDTYPARDGRVIICSMGDSAWLRLLDVLGRGALQSEEKYATAQKRFECAEEIDAMIAAWTQQHSVNTVVQMLNDAGIASGPILPVQQFHTQAYCRERRIRVEVPHPPGGTMATLGPLFKMSATPGVVDRGAPVLGQRDIGALLNADANNPRSRNRPPAERSPNSGKPLAGIRIVEMGAYTAVPYGTRLLALLGAEVIKVEPRQGDPLRRLAIPLDDAHKEAYGFHLYNTDKKSVTLAPDSPQGRALLRRLIRTSDVFVHNLPHDLIKRLDLTYEALHTTHPGLIYCVVSGFGQDGSWRTRRAFDTILQAFSGIMDVTGRPHRPPVKVGISVVDLFGALFATAAILAALHHVRQHGAGQFLDVALGDVAAWLTCEAWPLALTENMVSRVGNRHWFAAPHNLYRTRDRDVVLAVECEKQWHALLRLMGRHDLLGDARYMTVGARVQAVDEVDSLVQTWLAGLYGTDAVARCQEAGIPAALVQEVGEAVDHPLATTRGVIVTRDKRKFLGAPFRLSRTPVGVEAFAPAIGEHNEEIFAGFLGLRATEIEALRVQGVV